MIDSIMDIDFGSFIMGILVVLLGWLIISIIIYFKKPSEPQNFQQVKEKLKAAYEGNRISAGIISEIYSMFEQVEMEAKDAN